MTTIEQRPAGVLIPITHPDWCESMRCEVRHTAADRYSGYHIGDTSVTMDDSGAYLLEVSQLQQHTSATDKVPDEYFDMELRIRLVMTECKDAATDVILPLDLAKRLPELVKSIADYLEPGR